MRFVYVMDPMAGVLPDKDTTFALQRAAQKRGHENLHAEIRDVFAVGNEAWVRVRPVTVSNDAPYFAHGERSEMRLSDVDAVFIRKDPPFDAHYMYATQILELARGKTAIINDPRGLRDANEKLYALHFAKHMPRVLVAANREKLLGFLDEIGGVGVIKPLDGAGGAGVMRLAKDDLNARAIIENLTHEGKIAAMLQEYLPAVRQGDKRVLLLDGKILGGINRVPRADDLRSNIHVGGTVHETQVTPGERAIVEDIEPKLVADGLWFVGLDFIGGKLTEVNVTSPTGIQELSRHIGRDVADDVIAWAEKRAAR